MIKLALIDLGFYLFYESKKIKMNTFDWYERMSGDLGTKWFLAHTCVDKEYASRTKQNSYLEHESQLGDSQFPPS
jgi:hypothetical protein